MGIKQAMCDTYYINLYYDNDFGQKLYWDGI